MSSCENVEKTLSSSADARAQTSWSTTGASTLRWSGSGEAAAKASSSPAESARVATCVPAGCEPRSAAGSSELP